MTEDEKRVLSFCIGEWRHLTSLEIEIPRSTLYRLAKDLCGKNWLVHRRAKGYRVTQRGIRALGKDRVQTEEFGEKIDPAKVEQERAPKKPPVNLATIQRLLGLSEKTVNLFSLLYPPLKEVATPTHQAMIELVWAEICSRSWPVRDDHHLSFLNFAGTFAWKTNSGKFCAHMVAGEEITPYILELSIEGGCSLWIRKTSAGRIIFRREILEKPYICLDDYHRADRDGKRAAAHLLTGQMQIPVENEVQIIRCVTMVNLNPQKGETVFEKTGFDGPLIRRFIPCDLDAIELPNLKDIGQKALDSAAAFGPLDMKEPTSDCTKYRKELIVYFEKLFTEEGQRYIDIEGLLNVARGFTGYGFTPLEAVRYVLYKVSLPYNSLGWLQSEWVEGFREKPVDKIKKMPTPEMKIAKTSSQILVEIDKRDLETLKDSIRFQEEYGDELNKLKRFSIEIEEFKEFLEQKDITLKRIGQIFLEEGSKVPSPERCENAFQEVNKKYGNIQQRDWASLENLKEANEWLSKTYIKPLADSKQRIEIYEEWWDYIWERISNIKKIGQISPISEMIDKCPLVVSQKGTLKEWIDKKKTALKEAMRALREKHLARIDKVDTFPGWVKACGLILNDSSLSEELKNELGQVSTEKYKKLSIEIKRNLISYLKKEDAPSKDITQEFIGLGLIRKVTIVGSSELEGIDGNLYPIDEFDFSKYQLEEDPFEVLTIDRCKKEALSLLTTKIQDKIVVADREYRREVSKDLSRYTIDKAGARAKKTEVEPMQGDVALQALVKWAGKKMKNWWETRQQITKPIGTAEFFDSKINRLFKVQIWRMNIDAIGVKRYEVKFRDRAISSRWIEASKLRNVSISVEPNKQTNKTRPTQPLETTVPLRNPIGKAQLLHGGNSPWWGEAQVWNEKDDELGNKRYCVTWDGQTEPVWVHYSQIRKVLWFNH